MFLYENLLNETLFVVSSHPSVREHYLHSQGFISNSVWSDLTPQYGCYLRGWHVYWGYSERPPSTPALPSGCLETRGGKQNNVGIIQHWGTLVWWEGGEEKAIIDLHGSINSWFIFRSWRLFKSNCYWLTALVYWLSFCLVLAKGLHFVTPRIYVSNNSHIYRNLKIEYWINCLVNCVERSFSVIQWTWIQSLMYMSTIYGTGSTLHAVG